MADNAAGGEALLFVVFAIFFVVFARLSAGPPVRGARVRVRVRILTSKK